MGKQAEQFFEVDKDDNPLGPIIRSEANTNNKKYHRAVNIFVKIGNRFVITIRAQDKDTYPGKFDLSVSGHVSYQESYIDAAVRETEEELGIKLEPEDFIKLGKMLVKMPHENEFQMNYLLKLEESMKGQIKALEASSLKYMTLEEMYRSVDSQPGNWAAWAVESINHFRKELQKYL